MIKHFKIYNESLAFDRIEGEEVVANLEDFKEIYNNIFKDRWICEKGLGVHQVSEGEVFNIKDLIGKESWGIKYKGEMKLIRGWDCEVRQEKLKKGNYLIIIPEQAEKARILRDIADRDKSKRDRFGRNFRLRMLRDKEMIIPLGGRLELFNLIEYINLLKTFIGYSCVVKGIEYGSRKETVITGVDSIHLTPGGQIEIVHDNKMTPENDRDEIKQLLKLQPYYSHIYLDIRFPISCKRVHWVDPDIDPYGEEEWFDS